MKPIITVRTLATLGLGMFLAQPAWPAEDSLPFDDDWYRVEVVVFVRDRPADSQELLSTSAPRAYPFNVLAPAFLDVAAPGGGFAPLTVTPEPFPEPIPGPTGVSELDADATDQDSTGQDDPDPETAVDTATDVAGDPGAEAASSDNPMTPISPAQQLRKDFDEALATYLQSLQTQAYRWQVTNLQLAAAARGLERRGVGTVLLHGAWLQSVPDRAAPQPVLLQAGPVIDDRHRLEGSIAITRGRFLHAHAELWYQTPAGATREPTFLNMANSDGPVMAGIPYDLAQRVDVALPYQQLTERRRMRSAELHYLDHPSFGVLIIIDPQESPADLVALYEQVEEGVE
jgi:hypothetical protein